MGDNMNSKGKDEIITYFRLTEQEKRNLFLKKCGGSFPFQSKNFAVEKDHIVILNDDGTVWAGGNNDYGQCDVKDWNGIKKVCAGEYFTVGLKADGTAVAVGDNTHGQCNVSDWKDIVDIFCSGILTIGVNSDNNIIVSQKGSDNDSKFNNDSDNNIVCEKDAEGDSSSDYQYTVLADGTAEIICYLGEDTNIRIPSVVDGIKVTSIGSSAFQGLTKLKAVEIPNSVTAIGSYAFSGCEKLRSVKIPNSIKSIELGVFYKCGTLTTVIIPQSVIHIKDEAFYCCTKLSRVIIPNSVRSIGERAFDGCWSLTSVTIPNSVSISEDSFRYCTKVIIK